MVRVEGGVSGSGCCEEEGWWFWRFMKILGISVPFSKPIQTRLLPTNTSVNSG